jgi:D-tyrosyl-tRNA(Tyr) deacylase
MKAVLQRVSKASVTVDGNVVGAIDVGLVVLLGVEQGDSKKDGAFLAKKTVEMRIFPDQEGKMNRSLLEADGRLLVISQFTLIAGWKKGRRPSFIKAAPPEEGNRLYQHFVEEVRGMGVEVETGVFGAHMDVALVNDGPVTMILEYQAAAEQP